LEAGAFEDDACFGAVLISFKSTSDGTVIFTADANVHDKARFEQLFRDTLVSAYVANFRNVAS